MGASQDKMHCTMYLNGNGPPSVAETLEAEVNGTHSHHRDSHVSEGNQPDGGEMTWDIERRSLPGHPDCDTIRISFQFDDGIQAEGHPHPGQSYRGLYSVAYLPQNPPGTKTLQLMEVAFQHRLMFTVAENSSGEDCVMPADIPLKPMDNGGPESFGYPDPKYLKSVRKSLKMKGIK